MKNSIDTKEGFFNELNKVDEISMQSSFKSCYHFDDLSEMLFRKVSSLTFWQRKTRNKIIWRYCISATIFFLSIFFLLTNREPQMSWVPILVLCITLGSFYYGLLTGLKQSNNSEEVFIRRKELCHEAGEELKSRREELTQAAAEKQKEIQKITKGEIADIRQYLSDVEYAPLLKILNEDQLKQFWSEIKPLFLKNPERFARYFAQEIENVDTKLKFIEKII